MIQNPNYLNCDGWGTLTGSVDDPTYPRSCVVEYSYFHQAKPRPRGHERPISQFPLPLPLHESN